MIFAERLRKWLATATRPISSFWPELPGRQELRGENHVTENSLGHPAVGDYPAECLPESAQIHRSRVGRRGRAGNEPHTVGVVVSVAKGTGRDKAECGYQEPIQHQRKTDAIQRRDSLQQLLRVRSWQRGAGGEGWELQD